MKFLYIGALIVFFGAIALMIYLIPSKSDLAFLELKGNYIQQAGKYYEKYKLHSVEDINHLLGLKTFYLSAGKIKDAIQLLQDYVKTHPNDIYGYNMLAELFQEDQQYDNYYGMLEKIVSLDPLNAKRDKDLAFYYKKSADRRKYCSLVSRMVEDRLGDAEIYYALARCYGTEQNYGMMLNTLRVRREQFPRQVTLEDLLLELWTAVQLKAAGPIKAEILNVIINFIKEKNNPELAYEAISAVSGICADCAPSLIQALSPLFIQEPQFDVARLQILWAYPNYREEIYEQLLAKSKEGTLNTPYFALWIEILIYKKQFTLLEEFLNKISPQDLSKQLVMDLILEAVSEKQMTLLKQIEDMYAPREAGSSGLLGCYLLLATKQKQGVDCVKHLIDSGHLTLHEYLKLFELTAALNEKSLVLELGQHLAPFFGFTADQLFMISSVYVDLNKTEEFYQELLTYFPDALTNRSSRAALAFILFDVARGEPLRVYKWLDYGQKVDKTILQTLYAEALKKKEYHLAHQLALRLVQDFPFPRFESDLALSFIYIDEIDKGLALLEQLNARHPQSTYIREQLFTGLVFAAKQDSQYRSQLASFMKANPPQDSSALREYINIYMETLKDFGLAQELLTELASKHEATEDEISLLIQLMGPSPCLQERIWVERRARAASNKQLGFWLQCLSSIGAYDDVVQLYESRLLCKKLCDENAFAFFIYFNALSYLEKRDQIRCLLNTARFCFQEEKNIKKLALMAADVENNEARRYLWEELVARKPQEPYYWQQLASVCFDQNDYSHALCALERFFQLDALSGRSSETSYTSLYQYAEILTFRRLHNQAKRFYALALGQICSAHKKTLHMDEIFSAIQYRLGCFECALMMKYGLFVWTGFDGSYGASYVNLIMDIGALDWAKNLFKGKMCR